MKKPTITIVIPAFNEATRLAACLDAIGLQTELPDEVIVVDNNSADETRAIAERYKFVKVISEPKHGIVYARNAGFAAARCDIIARIDADTHLTKNWVAEVRQHFMCHRGALTGACYFYNVPCPELTARITNFFVYRVNKLTTGHFPVWGSNMAIWRADWLQLSPLVCNDTTKHEDLDIAIHLYTADLPIVYDPSLKAYAEMRTGFSGGRATWNYLMQWPAIQREHNEAGWVISYVVAVFLYLMRWVPVYAARWQLATARRWFAFDRH